MPKSITFDRYENGLDLRKGLSTSDANRLRVLKNAHVTEGKTIRKRPGTTKDVTLEAGTVGMFAGQGKMHTFYGGTTTITHANTLYIANNARHPTIPAQAIAKVHYADVFNGFMYAAVEYTNGDIKHHYFDGAAAGATHIVDANCPNTSKVIKIASKMWAISDTGETVRFSKTNTARDWTAANDAGFLPVSLQQSGSNVATALGFYSNRLVVFFSDSAQIWQVDVDPAKHAFLQAVDVGTTLPYSHVNMAGDVFFLSKGGVRTITRQETTTNLIDADVGSPIDRELVAGTLIDIANAKGQYYRGGGQFWLYAGNKVVVFTFSRTSGVSAWSLYEYPFNLDYIDELNADLYLRSGNNNYKLNTAVKSDDGVLYPVVIEMAYLDFKSPGIIKQIISMDAVITGTCTIAHRFDQRSVDLITNPAVTITGDTMPSSVLPVELMTTNLAPALNNLDANEFELHQLIYYFEALQPL